MPLPAISEKLSEDLNLKNTSLCYMSISRPILLKHPKVKNNMMNQIMDDKDPTFLGPSTNLNYACNHGLYQRTNRKSSETLYTDMPLLCHNMA